MPRPKLVPVDPNHTVHVALRAKCEEQLKASYQKYAPSDVDAALTSALERVDAFLTDAARVAVGPIARRLEQAAVDAAIAIVNHEAPR